MSQIHTTQGDYSGLSYDINIYTPAFAILRKNCLCQDFLKKFTLLSKKKNVIVTQIHAKQARHTLTVVITKKAPPSLSTLKKEPDMSRTTMGLQWSFIRNKYLYPSVPPFWEKIAYLRISWKKFTLLSQRRTWFVRQIHIITKESWHTIKGDYGGLFIRLKYLYPQRSAILRKNCLCKHFLQNIVLWAKKRTWFVTQIHDYN